MKPKMVVSIIIASIAVVGTIVAVVSLNKPNEAHDTTANNTTSSTAKVNPDTKVVFNDPKVEEIVKFSLGILGDDSVVTAGDMLRLGSFSSNGYGIVDLTGLEYATNMKVFSLYGENVKSLAPIENLASLETVSLATSEIGQPLLKLSPEAKLKKFQCDHVNITNLDFMKTMDTLKEVSVYGCGVNDINGLAKADSVTTVSLDNNSIKDISVLKGKNQLKVLSLNHNLIDDITPLENLASLEELSLSYNPVTNINSLRTLKKLKELTIYKTHETKATIFNEIDALKKQGVAVASTT